MRAVLNFSLNEMVECRNILVWIFPFTFNELTISMRQSCFNRSKIAGPETPTDVDINFKKNIEYFPEEVQVTQFVCRTSSLKLFLHLGDFLLFS